MSRALRSLYSDRETRLALACLTSALAGLSFVRDNKRHGR